jgi:hypothetical protein
MQAQPRIMSRSDNRMRVRGKVHQYAGQLSQGFRLVQLVQIVDDHDDAVALAVEFREHPVGQGPDIKVRCRGRWFHVTVGASWMTDRVQQSQPENLGILFVATHLYEADAVRPARALCPGAQQRRLATASRRGDDRHLPRCGAVQAGEKIAASDQPGSAHATFTRPGSALLLLCR